MVAAAGSGKRVGANSAQGGSSVYLHFCSADDRLFSVTAVLQQAGTQEGTQVGGAAQEVIQHVFHHCKSVSGLYCCTYNKQYYR